MPALTPTQLVQSVLDAVQQSGGSAVYLSDRVQTHPRKFGIHYQGSDFHVWVYLWTLTHGGGTARPDDEYRIQRTAVQSPLPLNPSPDGYTLLIGFYPDLGIFAGFDIQRHINFTPGSPSAQIKLGKLHEALQNGLAFYPRANEEIAVAIRPDQFLNYILNARLLHSAGTQTVPILERAAATEAIEEPDLAPLTEDRKRIVSEVSRISRAANFRRKILDAYGHRCAVTRMQLKLIDAAHILPVSVPGSTDATSNGIALSPTIHRAFDSALIYLDEDHVMRLNDSRADELRAQGRADGLSDLSAFLGTRVHLPADQGLWPTRRFVKLANKHRRIPGY